MFDWYRQRTVKGSDKSTPESAFARSAKIAEIASKAQVKTISFFGSILVCV